MTALTSPRDGGRRTAPGARATHDAVLRAAAEQFAAAGYGGSTVQQIASRAGVTKGAVYFHFPDKQTIARAVVLATISLWQRLVADIDAARLDPLTAVVTQTRRLAVLISSDPLATGGNRLINDPSTPHWSPQDNAAATAGAEAVIHQRLERAVAEELLRPPCDPAALAATIMAAVAGHTLLCERSAQLDRLPDRIDAMWAELLPRMASDRWLAAQAGSAPS